MKLSVKQKVSILILVAVFILMIAAILFFYAMLPKKYERVIQEFSQEFGVDGDLVYAVVRTESNFRADAVSRRGAVGLMQIMPSTAEFICQTLGEKLDLNVPEDNLRMGIWYISYLEKKFDHTDAVLAAYNAGEGTVLGWIRNGYVGEKGELTDIPYQETKIYVRKVNFFYNCYKMLY